MGILFIQIIPTLYVSSTKLDGETIRIVGSTITIGDLILHSGTKSIIDDIIIWLNTIPTILIYFECVCKVFQKYRVDLD